VVERWDDPGCGEGGRTEEETLPGFEEFEFCKSVAGAEVGLQGGEGFFAGWTVCGVCVLARLHNSQCWRLEKVLYLVENVDAVSKVVWLMLD